MPKITIPDSFFYPAYQAFASVTDEEYQENERLSIRKWILDKELGWMKNTLIGSKNVALVLAIKKQIQEFLTENKVCTSEEFIDAVKSGNLQTLLQLNYLESYFEAKSDFARTPLLLALDKGYVDVAIWLIKNKVKLDTQDEHGLTALHLAASRGYSEIVKILIAEGVDLDVDKSGHTALHLAASNGHEMIMQMLLTAGADIEARGEDDDTALHMAVEENHAATVQVLLAAGANIEAQDDNYETPLHYACKKNYEEITKILLMQGANTEAINDSGETPLQLAKDNNHLNIVTLVNNYAKNPKNEALAASKKIKELEKIIEQQQLLIKQLGLEAQNLKKQLREQSFSKLVSNDSQAVLISNQSSVLKPYTPKP